MKLKNVSFVELHVEKFVVALGALFFLVVVWQYALVDPYVVDMGLKTGVRPGQIEQWVLDEQSRLQQKIEPGSRSPLPAMAVPPYTVMFRKRINRPPMLADRFDPLSRPGLGHLGPTGLGRGPVVLPTPPVPHEVNTVAGNGVLLDHEPLVKHFFKFAKEHPFDGSWHTGTQVAKAYASLITQRSPRDFNYVSVGGLFDVEAWRKKWHQSQEISRDRWEAATVLVDVLVERQAFDPVQGQWSPLTVVAPLPGALSFRDPPKRWTTRQAQQAVALIKNRQNEVARPLFAPMTDAASWQTFGPSKASLHWRVWGHDLTVRPGVTYRYRLRVSMLNPLFQKSQAAGVLGESYFNQMSVQSPPSAWTEPVVIDPVYRFFVVGGSGSEREATIEVWRLFNGRARVGEFRVNPGDLLGGVVSVDVGGVARDLDMRIGALAVDLVDTSSGASVGGKSTLVYVDLETNKLMERTIEVDRDSPVRTRLIGQVSVEAVTTESAEAVGR